MTLDSRSTAWISFFYKLELLYLPICANNNDMTSKLPPQKASLDKDFAFNKTL